MKRVFGILVMQFIFVNPTTAAEADWSSWHPVPIRSAAQKAAGFSGGEGMQMVTTISYAPSNPNITYLGVNTTNVWKSVDGGNSWISQRNGLRAKGAGSLVVDPKDENTVFASSLVQDVDETSKPDSIAAGIYRTTDGGGTWQRVYQTNYYSAREGQHFAFDPGSFDGTRHQTIYAGTHSVGILKSTDGGTSWMRLQTNTSLDNMRILDMEIHKSGSQAILYVAANNNNDNGISASANGLYKAIDNNGTITASTIGNLPDYPRTIAVVLQTNTNNDIIYAAAGTSRVFKSTDGGNTFVSKSNGLTTNGEYKNISISPVDPNYLYVRTQLSAPNIFYSHDGGETWQQPDNFDEGNLLLDSGGGFFGNQVAFHPTDKNTAITHFQADRLVKTINGGQTWRYSGNGYMGAGRPTSQAAYFDPGNPNKTIYFFADHGPFITEDNRSTWRPLRIPRIDGRSTPAAAIDPNNTNTIITAAGTWSLPRYTLIRTTNGGNNESDWSAVSPAFEESLNFISFHPQNSNYVYAGFDKTGLISQNNGQTWASTGNRSIRAVYPGNGDIIYALEPTLGSSILWRSTDRGVNWVSLGNTKFRNAKEVAIDPQDPNTLYAAAMAGIYKFNGGTWTEIGKSGGIPEDIYEGNALFSAMSVVVDPTQPGRVYAGLGGYGAEPRNMKYFIFRSVDYGQNWQDIGYNLGEYSTILTLSVDPRNGDLHASTRIGNYVLVNSSGDTTAPSVSITSPTTSATYSTTTDTIPLSGTSSDNIGISAVSWTNSANSTSGTASGTTSWSVAGIALVSGNNAITVTAKDAVGNSSSDTIAVTYETAISAPVITSSLSSTGTIGTDFSYQITAINIPVSFAAAGLPAGLSVNSGTGLISGTPTAVGTSSVTISAVNAGGTGVSTLTLSVYSACDLNRDASTNVVDVQLQVNQALGAAACASDLNRDGLCNVIDVQRDVNASLGGPCVVGP